MSATRPPGAAIISRMAAVCFGAAAVALLVLVQTGIQVSKPAPAAAILRAALQEPTRAALQDALREQQQATVTVEHDLVRFSVSRTDAEQHFTETVAKAAADRATALYDHGPPPDPRFTRDYLGIPRPALTILSLGGHRSLAKNRTSVAILLGGAFLVCLLMSRNDNLLGLPAAAAVGGLGAAYAVFALAGVLLDRVAPGSATLYATIRFGSSGVLHMVRLTAIVLVLGAVFFRLLYPMLNRPGPVDEPSMVRPTAADYPVIGRTVVTPPSRNEHREGPRADVRPEPVSQLHDILRAAPN